MAGPPGGSRAGLKRAYRHLVMRAPPPTQRPVGVPSRLAGTAAEKNAGLRPQHPPGGHTSGKKDSSSHIRKEAPFLYRLAPTATKRIFVVLVHARTKTLYNGPYVSPPVSASLQTTRLGSPCIVPRKYDPGCLRPNQSSTKCFFLLFFWPRKSAAPSCVLLRETSKGPSTEKYHVYCTYLLILFACTSVRKAHSLFPRCVNIRLVGKQMPIWQSCLAARWSNLYESSGSQRRHEKGARLPAMRNPCSDHAARHALPPPPPCTHAGGPAARASACARARTAGVETTAPWGAPQPGPARSLSVYTASRGRSQKGTAQDPRCGWRPRDGGPRTHPGGAQKAPST